jgi:hypothetical protein
MVTSKPALPAIVSDWYQSADDGVESILCLVDGQFAYTDTGAQLRQSLRPVPLEAVLSDYRIYAGFIVVPGADH